MKVKLVAADLTKYIAWGRCNVKKIFGYNASASSFLQIFQKPTVANGDVPPVAALSAPTGQWFDWFFDKGLPLSEFLFAVSSTQPTYTAVGAGAGVDVTIEVETDCPACNESGTALVSIVGDLTSAVADRQVWADASGPKKLYRLDVKNNNVATKYVFVQPQDTAQTNTQGKPGPLKILTTETESFFFGLDGLQTAIVLPSGVTSDGCTVSGSLAATLPITFDATADLNIRAIVSA